MTNVLELPGLSLRPWQHDDEADILAAFGDPSIRQYSPRVVDTAAEAATFVDVRANAWSGLDGVSWAVTDSATSTVLGHVGISVVDRSLDYGMIGYWLFPRARGRGVATLSVQAATAFAFRHLELHRIELAHAIENVVSCRVADRCGYPYEGTLREAMRYGDRWSTEHLHARLVTDPDPPT